MTTVSTTAKVIIGLIVLVIVAGGVIFFTKEKAGGFSGTMFDLLDRGGNWQCTWAQQTTDLTANGTVFVSDEKFKSDTVSTTGSVTVNAHALSDGDFFYAWTDLVPIGIRMDLSAVKEAAQEGSAQAGEFGKDYTFDCTSWSPDESVFALPTDIVFSSMPAVAQ